MYKLGIDLGGTKIEGVVLDSRNEELYRNRIPTEQEGGYGHILNNLEAMYEQLVAEIGGKKHTFGIGTPGSVSHRTGLLKNSNTQCLNDQPVKDDLQRMLGRPFEIQNDANCFALAEALMGAAIGKSFVFGVIMGTGCGGGIVYQGDVLNGLQNIGGEWGHTSIDPNGPQCWCGNRGCVERFISGAGLEELYKQQFGNAKSLSKIVKGYRQNQEPEREFIQIFWTNFGRALANLINVLDPDVVVMGGGLSNIDELYTEGTREVAKRVFNDGFETPIVKNKLGDSAGVLGAALVGR